MALKDCYKIDNHIELNKICFADFNSDFSFKDNYKTKSYSVLILNTHNTHFNKEDFLFYLNTINEFVPVKFDIIYDSNNERYELKFIIDKDKKYYKLEMIFTTMLIRCVYEQDPKDTFHRIVYHFLKLLRIKEFNKIDKLKLFTIATNIYNSELTEEIKLKKRSFPYNRNHMLSSSAGCKIVTLKKFLDDIKNINYINEYFRIDIDHSKFLLSKENTYKKIVNDNSKL